MRIGKRSGRSLLLTILFAPLWSCGEGEAVPRESLLPFPVALRVEGNRIVDPAGNPVVLRGLSLPDAVWIAKGEDPATGPWNERLFDEMAAWGAKVVRLPIHPAVWRRYGAEASLAVLDQAIEWAAARRMYGYIDFHSIGFPPENEYRNVQDVTFGSLYTTTPGEIHAFWDVVSRRFANDSRVAFYELFNEPARQASLGFPGQNTLTHWRTWKGFMEGVIDTIRKNDPDKIVLVGGFQFAYDLSFVPQAPIERSNVVYSVHPYPSASWMKDWEIAFGTVQKQYALFVTEFGFDNAGDYPESAYLGGGLYRDRIIPYLEARGIGWTAWAFSPTFAPALLKDAGFAPTESGAFFRGRLLATGG